MEPATQNASERINLRLKRNANDLIERAAGFEGKSMSHFILTSALERAQKTVQANDLMTLNAENSRIFLEALSEPVRFNDKLKAALDEHARRVVQE